MKVGIFYNSITNPNKFPNKVALMDNFKMGVLSHGDTVTEFNGQELPMQDLDLGFVLGYTLENNFRRRIIDSLIQRKIPQVFVDSNILHYSRPEHKWHRYSLNGVYPTTGTYLFGNIDHQKWNTYSSWHGAELKSWRQGGQHILILCQRPNGWNMFGNNQDFWLDTMIKKIRSIDPRRTICIRMHPGDGTRFKQIERLQQRYGNQISISQNTNIREDLANCWCTVGYNSTPNVVSRIEGVPGYIEDPVNSWAQEVSFTNLEDIVNPPMPDRSEWIHKIANIHWSNEEVRTGQLWSAIRQYISSSR